MVRWLRDPDGFFEARPWYEPEELDAICEEAVEELLRARRGSVHYPIETDDLHVLIESQGADLDVFADLSGDGEETEGVTRFFPDRPPLVQISSALSTNPRQANRYRTTLTHEFGHVRLHGPLYERAFCQGRLSTAHTADGLVIRKRDDPMMRPGVHWMEWQAGYVCGAVLMPARAVGAMMTRGDLLAAGDYARKETSENGRKMIDAVRRAFCVSADAARVRLSQLGYLGGD